MGILLVFFFCAVLFLFFALALLRDGKTQWWRLVCGALCIPLSFFCVELCVNLLSGWLFPAVRTLVVFLSAAAVLALIALLFLRQMRKGIKPLLWALPASVFLSLSIFCASLPAWIFNEFLFG